jgi:hypothetical protein
MAKNHWNVRWTADYDEVSDVVSGAMTRAEHRDADKS